VRVLEYNFEESIGYWIYMAGRAYERAMNDELTPQGITHRQCQVLAWLSLEGPLSQVELAERMNIEPPTLVRVLDRMERDGLLAREACPGDRRRNRIRPLPKAETIWAKMVACAERVRSRATQGMTRTETATLRRLLAAVEKNLSVEHVCK
jgi:MarR family transcriptional regulator for hemolysin